MGRKIKSPERNAQMKSSLTGESARGARKTERKISESRGSSSKTMAAIRQYIQSKGVTCNSRRKP